MLNQLDLCFGVFVCLLCVCGVWTVMRFVATLLGWDEDKTEEP